MARRIGVIPVPLVPGVAPERFGTVFPPAAQYSTIGAANRYKICIYPRPINRSTMFYHATLQYLLTVSLSKKFL